MGILFLFIILTYLASEVGSEILRNRTVFIGRRNFKAELELTNDKDIFFKASTNIPYNDADAVQEWILQDESHYTPRIIGSIKEERPKVKKGFEFDFSSFPYVYNSSDGRRQSRMRRDKTNQQYILVHQNQDSHHSNASVGKTDFFGNDWTFYQDSTTIVLFTRKWFTTLKTYAVTMEAGSDIDDNFAAFVMFFMLNHGNPTEWQ
ncbi:hypothetical protein Ddc_15984 [Ditylenchus destructor]|nr:hypothetical protein Ddc_15984 [Ditylenchus destructor]